MDAQATTLLWHLCHLSNTLLSQFSAYLSLETMARDRKATNISTPVAYSPILAAQAMMMGDLYKNIVVAVEAMISHPAHQQLKNDAAYRCLLDTALALDGVLEIVRPGPTSMEQVQILRKAYDEMMELCYGNVEKGLHGWRQLWNEIMK